MGTRGILGLVIDGQEKIAYNHFDSYPEGMGLQVLADLRDLTKDVESFLSRARALQVVDTDVPPTPQQQEDLLPWADLGVSEQSTTDWYCLLRKTQGSLAMMLDAGYIEDQSGFPLDSLFCEWGYVVDLEGRDENPRLEVYRGFQKSLPTEGRWVGRPTQAENRRSRRAHVKWCQENGRQPWMPTTPEYKAVQLIASFPLGSLPSDEEFLAALGVITTPALQA